MFRTLRYILFNINEAKKGCEIYKKLKKESGDAVICVNQHSSLGDAYLMSLYLPQYFKNRKYIVTAIGEPSAGVFKYMGIHNVSVITQRETEQLIAFARVNGIREDTIKILHHQAHKWHIGIAWQFQGAYGLNFADLIEAVVFKGLTRQDRRYPARCEADETEFSKKGLVKGNSIILFPYANTLDVPPIEYWRKIVEEKKTLGKKVFTHIWKDEKPIEGTDGICLELNELTAAAEYAGEIICVRNGLADILSSADCKKTIIYPPGGSEGWMHGTLMDFWSINGFGYCSDAEEIIF